MYPSSVSYICKVQIGYLLVCPEQFVFVFRHLECASETFVGHARSITTLAIPMTHLLVSQQS